MPTIPGQGLQQLGQTLLQIPKALGQFKQLWEQNDFLNAQTAWTKGVNEFNNTLSGNPAEWGSQWEEAGSSLKQQINDNMQTGRARDQFELFSEVAGQQQIVNLGTMAEAQITQTALSDANSRLDEEIRDGNINAINQNFQMLVDAGVDKIRGKPIGQARDEALQDAYINQGMQFAERMAVQVGPENALAYINNPENKSKHNFLSQLDTDHYNDLIKNVESRVVTQRKQINIEKERLQEEGGANILRDIREGKISVAEGLDDPKYSIAFSLRNKLESFDTQNRKDLVKTEERRVAAVKAEEHRVLVNETKFRIDTALENPNITLEETERLEAEVFAGSFDRTEIDNILGDLQMKQKELRGEPDTEQRQKNIQSSAIWDIIQQDTVEALDIAERNLDRGDYPLLDTNTYRGKIDARRKALRDATASKVGKSTPEAELEAYRIWASDLPVNEKQAAIDTLVLEERTLTADDGGKWRKDVKTYTLTPEQKTVYTALDVGIRALIDKASSSNVTKVALSGSRAFEHMFTLFRNGEKVEDVRKIVLNMLDGGTKEAFEDEGVFTRPPDDLSPREVATMEAISVEGPEGKREPIPGTDEVVAARLGAIREIELKAWRANFKDLNVDIVEFTQAPDQEWLYYDRPLPRKRDGKVDAAQFQRGGYNTYKTVVVEKAAGIMAFEFYRLDEENKWEQIGWSYYRKVEKFEE